MWNVSRVKQDFSIKEEIGTTKYNYYETSKIGKWLLSYKVDFLVLVFSVNSSAQFMRGFEMRKWDTNMR